MGEAMTTGLTPLNPAMHFANLSLKSLKTIKSRRKRSMAKDSILSDATLAKRHQIDRFLAQSHHLGQQRLNVQVDYLNTPLGYQYLNQHHGLSHPLSHTPFASQYGLSG